MALLYTGVYYFGTISAAHDYQPSPIMMDSLKKKFKDFLIIVIENGESGKEHCHFVGISTVRIDNLKNSLRKILEADGVDVSNYTLDLRPEPNVKWRVGYLQKELTHKILFTNIGETTLAECLKDYALKPKRDRGLKQEKCMSKSELVEYIIDSGVKDRQGIIACLNVLKEEGRISFQFFEKLNTKKLILWITGMMDDNNNL